ncbi:MAG: hypothetical protein WA840_19740 [Caulobacteraceae bacterium]
MSTPSASVSTPAPGPGVNRALAGFRFVEIQQGDTLHTIAARELSDTTKWADLIAINGLSYPYITGDPTQANDAVRLYGQLLIVPAATAQVQATADPDRVYGVDLLLQNGQLTASNGDLALVGGVANLGQALMNRLATSLRELLFHLDYGNGARGLLGQVNGPTAILLAAQYVKSAVLQEARIQTVNSSVATAVGDQIQVAASVSPITGAPIALTTSV